MAQEQPNPEAETQQQAAPPATPAVQPPQDAPGGGQQPVSGEEHIFTQADLNRLVPERGKQYFRSMLGDLGVENAEELKSALAKLKEAEQAQMSEIEKAQRQAQEATEAARKAQEERDRAQEQARDTLIRAAVMSHAATAGAAHPEDAYYLANLGLISIGDDGKIEGADKAVAALVEAGRLPLRGRAQAPNLDAGAGSGERSGQREPALLPEELEIARKLGVKPEDYQKHKHKKE